MVYFFAGITIVLLLATLRDEFARGGSLFPAFDAARAEQLPILDVDEIPVGWTIISPHGVEIPVGALSAAAVVEGLAAALVDDLEH